MVGCRNLMAPVALALLTVVLASCERKITRVEPSTEPLSCVQCHDASSQITAKQTEWAESLHGTGEAYVRSTSASCAACHSGNGFAEAVAAGVAFNKVAEGQPNPTRQDCRACHMIHETYTQDDYELRTTEPVKLYAIAGATFDGGEGNLCANCHQPRSAPPAAVDGVVSGINARFGPHHGPQSSMMLGLGGADATGTPSGHYGAVTNTCVDCHMGANDSHSFEPAVATCVPCHPGATNFDIGGVQTEIAAMTDSLGAKLLAAGLITENSPEGAPAVTSAPAAQANAIWNWIYVLKEDKSRGVHNPEYTRVLLKKGLNAMK